MHNDMFSVYVYNDVSNFHANFPYVNATCDFLVVFVLNLC